MLALTVPFSTCISRKPLCALLIAGCWPGSMLQDVPATKKRLRMDRMMPLPSGAGELKVCTALAPCRLYSTGAQSIIPHTSGIATGSTQPQVAAGRRRLQTPNHQLQLSHRLTEIQPSDCARQQPHCGSTAKYYLQASFRISSLRLPRCGCAISLDPVLLCFGRFVC